MGSEGHLFPFFKNFQIKILFWRLCKSSHIFKVKTHLRVVEAKESLDFEDEVLLRVFPEHRRRKKIVMAAEKL